MVWVERTNKTTTFDDVTQLAIELYGYATEKQRQKELEAISMNGESAADEHEMVTNEGGESEGEMTHEEMLEEAARREGEWREDIDQDSDLDTPSYSYGGSSINETESITDAALQEALQTLVDDNAKEWVL